MTREGYIKIMQAVAHLVKVIMIEAGKSSIDSANKVYYAIVQATTGKKIEDQMS